MRAHVSGSKSSNDGWLAITKHIGPYEHLLATVKWRKLKWYGHVTRSDGLTKVMLAGTVEGRRRRGQAEKRWADKIAEWTGISFAGLERTDEEVRHDAPLRFFT